MSADRDDPLARLGEFRGRIGAVLALHERTRVDDDDDGSPRCQECGGPDCPTKRILQGYA